MHKITIIDKNFEEKSLELNYSQLVELNKWLNIYLNSGKVFEGRIKKYNVSISQSQEKKMQM
jgi:hypothetical protein